MTLAQAYGRAYRTVDETAGFAPVTVDGALPPDLRGTFWRNGPGQFEVFGRPYVHWFDADGAVTAVRIADGRAAVASRVVACPRLAEERAAGKALYASGQTRASWWRMVGGRGKAVRNINVLDWRGQAFALAEGGLPIPIDPETLASGPPRALMPGQPSFHAHYRTDPATGQIYGFGLSYGRVCALSVYRLGVDGAASLIARMAMPGQRVLVHDIAFAGDALILMVHPMSLRIAPLMLGIRAPLETLQWQPEQGTEVIVVPLAAPDRPLRFPVPAFFHFHFGNAFRDGDAWQVDLCRMPRLAFEAEFGLDAIRRGDLPDMPSTRLARMTVRGQTAEVQLLSEGDCEFPAVDPRLAGARHRYTWAVVGPHDLGGLARFDHTSGQWAAVDLGPGLVPGEPTLVPRGQGEDALWVLAQVYDVERARTGMVVLDGAAPDRPPVARLWYGHHVPPGLHGCFVPAGAPTG